MAFLWIKRSTEVMALTETSDYTIIVQSIYSAGNKRAEWSDDSAKQACSSASNKLHYFLTIRWPTTLQIIDAAHNKKVTRKRNIYSVYILESAIFLQEWQRTCGLD
jgi:hypothetical protein